MTRVTTGALVCAAALLCGCQLDGEIDVTVDGDGGGTMAFTVAADEELLRAAGDAGVDPLAHVEQAGAGLEGWDVARRDAGGGAAITLSTSFSDGRQLERITGDFARALAGPELAPLGPMRVAVTDDTVTLDGTAGLAVTSQVRELGLTRRQAHEQLAESVDVRVSARMPGQILRTNADERPDDTTAVWHIEAGERRTLEVTAHRPWSLARVLSLIGGPYVATAVVIGVLGVAGFAMYRWRRRDATPDDEDEPATTSSTRRARLPRPFAAPGSWRSQGAYDAEAVSRSALIRARSLRT